MSEGGRAAGGLAEVIGAADDHEAMLREVIEGLSGPDKRISSKFHYDERGSELFERITRLDEYYPTRTERALLERTMPTWVGDLRPRALAELGAGNSEKSRVILDAMAEADCAEAYVPIDVSEAFLRESAGRLRAEYPDLDIVPVAADLSAELALPEALPQPAWIAFLGSTLGNFDRNGASKLLGRVGVCLRPDDRFLLGVDLRPGPYKSAERIELAYNDAEGITAAFSLNVLAVLNDQVGSDFDPSAFRHRSRYDVAHGRIETDLVSRGAQVVRFPDGTEIRFKDGEAIRTEISSKYDRASIDELFASAGLSVERWEQDEKAYFALVLGRPARRVEAA